jgi:hypothetical protein
MVKELKLSFNQLPAEIAAETTSLIATVEGHLSASPPNAVAAREALALIRDQLLATRSAVAESLAKRLAAVLADLDEPVVEDAQGRPE